MRNSADGYVAAIRTLSVHRNGSDPDWATEYNEKSTVAGKQFRSSLFTDPKFLYESTRNPFCVICNAAKDSWGVFEMFVRVATVPIG